MSRLREPTVLVAVHWDPHVERIIETLRATPEMYAPQLIFPRDVTQRLKRNRDFDRVAVARDHSLRVHDQIETEVFALAFSPNPIGLDSERVEVKLVSASLIVESVEEDADVIVVPDVVALRDIRAHFRRIVETMECDVEVACVVTEHHFGAILGYEIVAGLNLVEVLEYYRSLPHFIVKLSVDNWGLGEENGLYRIGFFGGKRESGGFTGLDGGRNYGSGRLGVGREAAQKHLSNAEQRGLHEDVSLSQLEAARKVPAHLDARGPKNLPERADLKSFSLSLLAGSQKNLPFARLQNEQLPAVADSPALQPRRGRDVLVNYEPFVGEVFHGIGFDREAGACRHRQRNCAVARARRHPAEVAIESDGTVAGTRIDLPVKLNHTNNAVAGVHLKLSAAIRDLYRTIARAKRDLAGDSIKIQRTIA